MHRVSWENDVGNKANKWFIIAGYLLAMLGGLFGLFIGGILIKEKEKGDTGERSHKYDHASRTHGKIIFVLALVSIFIQITLNLR